MTINLIASDLIKSFFKNLNSEKIQYAVLRNYELLPEANDSKDIDMVVAAEDINKVVTVLQETAQDNNYQLIWKNELDYLEGFVFAKIENNNVYSIKFDIFNGFEWRGCSYIDPKLILDSAVEYNGFKVPLKAHEAFIMIVYYVLYAKKFKAKYLKPIYTNAITNLDDFKVIVNSTFEQELASNIIRLVQENKIDDLISLRKKMRSNIVKDNFKTRSITKSFFKHIYTEYNGRNKFGTMIAFSGPDGAGKSTLVDAVMEIFYSLGINGNKIPHHLLTSNIPSLHKLPGAPKKYAKQDYTKPYHAKTAGFLSSSARTVYYYFAFLFDRIFYIKKEMRENKIVIFDRYYTDIMADPVRIRIGLNKTLIEKILNTLPSPDFTFVILAEKEKILSRKAELTEEKLEQLLVAYASLPKVLSNCTVLNNNRTVEEGMLMICKNVFNKLEERYK